MYFGIKFYVANRKKALEKDAGEGICAECGSSIFDKKCPNCDSVGE
ncbi:Zn-ribbon protein [Nitrosarchaeum koreense MY1]|uniref:Zn-ribbon protein n=2 Tax=Nitrosarchaeum TaxID=1007082 RepID=F9CVR9_9ARCH|nr:Zn-ribbon protein [Nitrosarchaeum koreense MY1]